MMTSAVSKEDVARLHAYLMVPVVVADCLASAAPMEGDAQYAMHVALSEIDPDSALLAVALSAYRIAQEFPDNATAGAVRYEADRIIAEYGPDWLAHYSQKAPTGKDLYDLLMHVPEDLDSIAELLEGLQATIRDEAHPAHTLCAILSIQARAHMEIAEYVINQLENGDADQDAADGVCTFETAMLYAPETISGPYTDNIILFPVHRVRQ